MFDRRLMLLCPERKKYILGNSRALCFPSPNNSVKKDPPLSRFTRQTGDFFSFSDKQGGDVIDDAGEE